MRPGNRRVVVVCCGFLFLLAVLIAVLLVSNGLGGSTLSSGLAISILASLVTAAALGAIGVVWAATGDSPATHAADLEGLKRVRKKSALGPDDWLEILTSAKHEFYIAGHSLGKWCSPSNHSVFTSNVARILKDGGRVTLVMLDPGNPELDRLQRATGIDYSDRIRHSMSVLATFEQSLSSDESRRLTIAMVKDHDVIPYMVVGNEHSLITATYLASTDSDAMICLELGRESEPAAAIYDDFRKLADAGGSAPMAHRAVRPSAERTAQGLGSPKPGIFERVRERISRRTFR